MIIVTASQFEQHHFDHFVPSLKNSMGCRDAGPGPDQQNVRRGVDLKVDDIMISYDFKGFSC